MAAIEAFRAALSALGRNPVLFLVGLLYGVITLPQSAAQLAGVPLVPNLLQILTFFVTPFVVAGLLGMAMEALDDETSLSTLTRVGKARYVPLLVGNLVELAITIVFGIVVAIVAAVTAIAVLGVGGVTGTPNAGALAVVALVVGVVLLAFLLVFFFVQFYPVAIVVDETDTIDGFRASYRLVRDNLVSALGYSVISLLVGLVTTIPISGFVFWRTLQNLPALDGGAPTGPGAGAGGMPPGAGGLQSLGFSTTEIVVVSLISLATTMLLFTFQRTFATAFYRRHEPRKRPSDFADFGDRESESTV
jgi:hypothetical protein